MSYHFLFLESRFESFKRDTSLMVKIFICVNMKAFCRRDGSFFPCSQLRSVAIGVSSHLANCICVSLRFFRNAFISVENFISQPFLARLNSFRTADCRIRSLKFCIPVWIVSAIAAIASSLVNSSIGVKWKCIVLASANPSLRDESVREANSWSVISFIPHIVINSPTTVNN